MSTFDIKRCSIDLLRQAPKCLSFKLIQKNRTSRVNLSLVFETYALIIEINRRKKVVEEFRYNFLFTAHLLASKLLFHNFLFLKKYFSCV